MGNIDVRVTTSSLDMSEFISFKPSLGHGAMNSFVGIVRNLNLGKSVIKMEYDCFIPLCEKTFFDIAKEAQDKWCTDANILIVHRHGKVEVGEASVVIFATTGHRDEAYRITRYIIEEIKVRAPIWKKEFYENGETDWVRGHALCQHRKVDHNENVRGHSCGREIHSHEAR
mgnify:FL=1